MSGEVLYRLEDDNPSTDVDGTWAGRLPGTNCPECGPWCTTGLVYPTIIPPLLAEPPGPLGLQEYADYTADFRVAIGEEQFNSRVWKPGALLGAFDGTGEGLRPGQLMVPDFTSSLFIEVTAFADLQLHFPLHGAIADIKWGRAGGPRYIEVEVVPSLTLLDDEEKSTCPLCGRLEGAIEPLASVVATSYHPGLGLYRGRLATTVLYCSQSFKDRAARLGLKGLTYHPIALV